MDGGPRFWLGVLVACVVVVVAVWGITSLFDDSEERARIEAVREELRVSRAAVDSCRMSVSREEVGFQDYDRRVDSLRQRVDRFESMDPAGVPADSYQVYMEAFEAYNRAVPDWAARADTLQAHWSACREAIREHNVLADSLRRLIGPEAGGAAEETPMDGEEPSGTAPAGQGG